MIISTYIKKLESLDCSPRIKDVPRKEWPLEFQKGEHLFWQVPRSTAQFLFSLVSFVQPKILLELGTSVAYSAIWLASAMPTGAHLHSIEFSEKRHALAKESISACQLNNQVTLYQGKFAAVLETWNQTIDFLFIDADKLAYLENFMRLEPFFKKGTLIVADNILDDPVKMKPFTDYLRSHKDFSSTIVHLDNGLLVARKN